MELINQPLRSELPHSQEESNAGELSGLLNTGPFTVPTLQGSSHFTVLVQDLKMGRARPGQAGVASHDLVGSEAVHLLLRTRAHVLRGLKPESLGSPQRLLT